jgi:two-component system nitrogen regulation sensor histidine kinase GlnL
VRRLIHAEYHDVSGAPRLRHLLPDITGDREQLMQAILNISRNAAQAMHGKGEIVRAFRTRAARQVTLAKKHYQLALELQVIDNGPAFRKTSATRSSIRWFRAAKTAAASGSPSPRASSSSTAAPSKSASRPGRTCFSLMLPLARKKREDA